MNKKEKFLKKFKEENSSGLLSLNNNCYVYLENSKIYLINENQRFIINKEDINENKLIELIEYFEKTNNFDFVLLQNTIESILEIKLMLEILNFDYWKQE